MGFTIVTGGLRVKTAPDTEKEPLVFSKCNDKSWVLIWIRKISWIIYSSQFVLLLLKRFEIDIFGAKSTNPVTAHHCTMLSLALNTPEKHSNINTEHQNASPNASKHQMPQKSLAEIFWKCLLNFRYLLLLDRKSGLCQIANTKANCCYPKGCQWELTAGRSQIFNVPCFFGPVPHVHRYRRHMQPVGSQPRQLVWLHMLPLWHQQKCSVHEGQTVL